MQKKYTSLGLMSGTSGDGVDASIIISNGIDQYEVREILDIDEIAETRITSYQNFNEVKIDFISDREVVYITIIK